MKKCLLLSVLSLVCFLYASAQVPNIELQLGDKKNVIPISVIDSITYGCDGSSFNQIIWNNGREYTANVNDVNQVSFISEEITYNTFEAKEYGIENGIINSLGQYAAIGKDTITNNGAVIIIGDMNKDKPEITVHIDSLKLIRYVYCENIVYRYFYGENDFTILALSEEGDSINCETFTYNQLQESRAKARGMRRAGGTISNSGWYNLFSLIDMGTSMNANPTNLASNWASIQQNPYLSYGGDIAGLALGPWYSKALILLKWFDNIWSFCVFKGASITTLPHEDLSVDAMRLKCNITGLNRIPRIRNLEAYAVCSMRLRAISGLSGASPNEYMKWDTQERRVNSDGEQNFDYSNLLLETQYEYYPQLNLAWTEVEASVWVKLTDDVMPDIEDWTVTTEEHRSFQSIRGNQGEFFTSGPSVTTGEPQYVYVTDAVVSCSFANVPNDASCGIEYTDGSQTRTKGVSNKEGESFPIIDGLKPGTNYTYKAFVQTKYKKYYGKKVSFTTKTLSCSTGDVVSKTDKSAIVKCTYNNAEGFECGVMVSGDNGTMKISTSSNDGERDISISGLRPATTYNYWAYVEVDGVSENGEVKSFTTDLPNISGTWNCVEHHVRTNGSTYDTSYSLTLGSDGKVQWSESSEIYSSSWSFSRNGTVKASIMDLATQYSNSGREWNGTVDDIENPTKITGGTYRWNYNQIGYFESDSVSFEMTR